MAQVQLLEAAEFGDIRSDTYDTIVGDDEVFESWEERDVLANLSISTNKIFDGKRGERGGEERKRIHQ